MQVNMHEAKSQLSRLGELACQGERVIIAKAGKPYLELLPYREKKEPRQLGGLEGQRLDWPWDLLEWTEEEIEEMFYKDNPDDPLFQ